MLIGGPEEVLLEWEKDESFFEITSWSQGALFYEVALDPVPVFDGSPQPGKASNRPKRGNRCSDFSPGFTGIPVPFDILLKRNGG